VSKKVRNERRTSVSLVSSILSKNYFQEVTHFRILAEGTLKFDPERNVGDVQRINACIYCRLIREIFIANNKQMPAKNS
jgi:hypothetical protein